MSDATSATPIYPSQNEWGHSAGGHATERHLGLTLRAMYDAMPAEPPCEKLTDLLRRLDVAGAAVSEQNRTA